MIHVLKNISWRRYTVLSLAILLFLLSYLFNNLSNSRSSVVRESKILERFLAKRQHDFDELLKDTTLVNKLVNNAESLKEFTPVISKPYGVFIYAVNPFSVAEMKFWNEQSVVPSAELVTSNNGEYFSHLPNGWYYGIRRSRVDEKNRQLVFVALVPVKSEFFIETDYLPRKFMFDKTADKRVVISGKPTDFPVRSPAGKILFYFDKKLSGAVPYNDWRTNALRLAAMLLLFLFIHLVSENVTAKHGAWRGIFTLFFFLLAFRMVTYYFPSILNLRQFELFSPLIYGSNIVQRSLGDLLINSILFGWFVLFAWTKIQNRATMGSKLSPKWQWAIAAVSMMALIFSTFVLANVIRSLVSDSKISFDVTNFFGLNQYTVIGFVVLACLSLAYYYLSQILFRFIFPPFGERRLFAFFAIGIAGLIYLTLRTGHADVLFYIPVLCWLLIYSWLANRQGVIISRVRINIAGILSWIFIFSLSISVIMLSENNKVEWEMRKRMADKLAVQTDPSSERLMSIAIQYLDNDFLSDNFYRFSEPVEGKIFRDSIVNENYSGYLNKYETRLYVYDSTGTPLYNDDAVTFESLSTILDVQSKPTKIPGLYYYETAFDKFNYITRREVRDDEARKLGTFFIVSNPKNSGREELFPELFRQFKNTDPENSPIYSNAVYINKRLASLPGNYPFPTWLTDSEVPKDEFIRRTNGESDELWYKASNDKVIVIARKKETTIETITLFSYIFCSFLFLVALVQFISFVLRSRFTRRGFKKLFQFNIRSQVHSTIISISVFSFVIIGIATISFFISRYNRNNSDKLSRTMKIMVNEMEKKLAEHNTFDDVVKIYDSVSNAGLQSLVNEVSDIHGVDVNVYDLDGNLQVSSEANVYKKGVLSKKIDPVAFYHLSHLRQVQHAKEERIGNFSYLSIYSPVRDEDGKVYAYINIPYFTSKPELRQEISNFLVTIINLNAFIFLIAGLIALFITNRITRSFSIISEKMREVNLGKMNEQIAWNRNDEIGELVKEYNKMVEKLGESATALAKSEREGAWREMARQVAHEIKNPLTPMKLSIQYLQKAISNNQPNVQELSASVARTLVEQIDHLSKIAADFSQFANIGTTHVEQFDLHDILNSLKDLFQPSQNVVFTWNPVSDPLIMNADKTQMNRLFTNLFTNAVEATRRSSICHIEVSEKLEDEKVIISITDNGEGIPPETQPRIFIPNFTTKSSGTGLGLAMCKGIVEQAHGRIWFETEQRKGTTFFVELPLNPQA